VIDEGGLFVGAGAYNKEDDCIYFATSRGIHKIKSNQSKSEAAELVVDPALRWGREPWSRNEHKKNGIFCLTEGYCFLLQWTK
jgi:hypothetical protein